MIVATATVCWGILYFSSFTSILSNCISTIIVFFGLYCNETENSLPGVWIMRGRLYCPRERSTTNQTVSECRGNLTGQSVTSTWQSVTLSLLPVTLALWPCPYSLLSPISNGNMTATTTRLNVRDLTCNNCSIGRYYIVLLFYSMHACMCTLLNPWFMSTYYGNKLNFAWPLSIK